MPTKMGMTPFFTLYFHINEVLSSDLATNSRDIAGKKSVRHPPLKASTLLSRPGTCGRSFALPAQCGLVYGALRADPLS